jgi:hypothetical protein
MVLRDNTVQACLPLLVAEELRDYAQISPFCDIYRGIRTSAAGNARQG